MSIARQITQQIAYVPFLIPYTLGVHRGVNRDNPGMRPLEEDLRHA